MPTICVSIFPTPTNRWEHNYMASTVTHLLGFCKCLRNVLTGTLKIRDF